MSRTPPRPRPHTDWLGSAKHFNQGSDPFLMIVAAVVVALVLILIATAVGALYGEPGVWEVTCYQDGRAMFNETLTVRSGGDLYDKSGREVLVNFEDCAWKEVKNNER